MDIVNVISNFMDYAKYDPKETTFSFGSSHHLLHDICDNVKQFVEFDPSCLVAVVYLKRAFLKYLRNYTVSLDVYLRNPDKFVREKEFLDFFDGEEMSRIENGIADTINAVVTRIVGNRMLGQRDMKAEVEHLEYCLPDAVSDLRKCNREVYIKGGPLQPLKFFSTSITVFETLADCLLALEYAADGVYLCYINYNNSADGFFGFFIKNNGNIFSLNDRVRERFPGQHEMARNGRWMEDKKDSLFPYNYIFNYTNHDYKGYASTFEIQDDKLDFFVLTPEVYMPLVVAMAFISNNYSDGNLDEDAIVYCNTLFENNRKAIDNGKTLAVIGESSIAEVNRKFVLDFDADKLKSAEYASELNKSKDYIERGAFPDENSMFVEMYGANFSFDEQYALSTETALSPFNQKTNSRPEFVATENQMKLVAYKNGRNQLAEYIRDQMCEELKAFGGMEAVEKWWAMAIQDCKDRLFDICAKQFSKAALTPEEEAIAACLFESTCDNSGYGTYPYNPKALTGYSKVCACPLNGKRPSIMFKYIPNDWTDLERLMGPLPKIVRGWVSRNTIRGYGNPLLDVVDAVSFVGTPFEEREHERNKRLWTDEDWNQSLWRHAYAEREDILKEKALFEDYTHSKPMTFSFAVKFSKTGLKTRYKEMSKSITHHLTD